jgi:hypothetical protein
VGPTENKPNKYPLEEPAGLMRLNFTYKPSYLDKKRFIRGLLVGLIINPSKPNTS